MTLETGLTRGMENAQDPLNQNFIEIQQAIRTASFLYDGTGLMESTVQSNYDNAKYSFYRIGNLVLLNMRMSNKTAATTWQTLIAEDKYPIGFKPTQRGDTWNIPLNVQQQNSGTSAMKALITQKTTIFYTTATGNHYISGVYYTDDPMPEA